MVSVTGEGAAKVEPEIDDGRRPEARTREEDDLGATVQPRLLPLRQRLGQWWEQFLADVFGEHASVGPLGGWLLLALLGVVTYLTLVYAEGAVERSQMAEGADKSRVISVESGYWTILIVALLALFVGFEPQLRRRLEVLSPSAGRRWFGRRPGIVQLLLKGLRSAMHFVWRLPSLILSLLDYVLARVIAPLAGATQKRLRCSRRSVRRSTSMTTSKRSRTTPTSASRWSCSGSAT